MTSMHLNDFKAMDRAILMTIVVAALGYFVDIFDLLLFSIVRMQSLKELGVPEAELLSVGIRLINTQMAGLLIGGFLWGILGDRMGRLSVLFGSIALYSIANIANGFATSVDQYAVFRFVAGVGLAGELGAGVSLASELLPRRLRGLGTTFIAMIGVLGATFAAVVAEVTDWRMAYMVGGVMGLALLALRVKARESNMYEKLGVGVSRGNVLMLFTRWELLKRYIAVILVGVPLWGIVGLFITFTPEFAKDFGMTTLPKAGLAVLFCYAGVSAGDLFSGVLSQALKSRRKSVAVSLTMLAIFIGVHTLWPHDSVAVYYFTCTLLGFAAGYWAMFVQMGAEQFGTNIRSTAATSIPNVVRGATIPMAAGFHALIPSLGVTGSGVTILAIAITAAFIALWTLTETFEADLDYTEK